MKIIYIKKFQYIIYIHTNNIYVYISYIIFKYNISKYNINIEYKIRIYKSLLSHKMITRKIFLMETKKYKKNVYFKLYVTRN